MNRFAVTVTHALDDTDRATVGVVVANAAAASGKTTLMFLSNDGVHLAVPGYAEAIHQEGFAPLAELLASFTAAGGQILVCTPCAKVRGIDLDHLVAGAMPGGGAGLVEFMTSDGGAASVSY
jgi:uncharacterized protein